MDVIDEALRELRDTRPSTAFVPRLRAHVESLPRPARTRWWIPVAAATAALVVSFASARRGTDRPVAPLVGAPLSARALPLSVPAWPLRGRPPVRAARARQEPRTVTAEVIVPFSQRAAIERLLDAINEGRTDGAVVARALRSGGDLVVPPIRIDPVVVPALPGTP
jgi:hypothetical protein